jgi:AcrR family transcriptional regulator
MSRKVQKRSPQKRARKPDRRVERTRNALGAALIALMQEKPFETITVQQVLDRAGIGRSTFYAHYRDKNDLLLSDMEDFLEMASTALSLAGEKSNRVAAVRELFAHVGEMRDLRAAMTASGKMRDFLELGQEYFARGIARRLAELSASVGIPEGQRVGMSHALAGAMFALMLWWVGHGAAPSAEEMDCLFHRMVWDGVMGEGVGKKLTPHHSPEFL